MCEGRRHEAQEPSAMDLGRGDFLEDSEETTLSFNPINP